MDIIINKEKVDFDLSEENNNCASILDDIKKWLFQKKHIVMETLINGSAYNSDEHEKLVPDEISKIELFSEHIEILAITSLNEVKNYTERVQSYITDISENSSAFSGDKLTELFLQVKDGYNWCFKAVENIMKITGFENNESALNQSNDFKFKLNGLEGILSPDDIKRVFSDGTMKNVNDAMINIVIQVYNDFKSKRTLLSFDEILDQITEYEDKIMNLNEALVAVSEKLQTGETAAAMDSLKNIIEILQKIMQFYSNVKTSLNLDYTEMKVNDKTLQDYLDDILKLMKDFLEAFENQDHIMIADLLEYELTDYIDVFKNSFSQIKEKTELLKTTSEIGQ